MTALLSGPEFWFTFCSGGAAIGGCALALVAHALHETRGVTLRQLFRDWAETGERRQ